MNVFNRKMFQKGGEANDFLASVRGPEFEPYQLSPSIEQSESGEFVYTLRNPRGEIVSEEFINTALSPTGDPVEAYKVQSKNKAISGAQKGVIGTLSAIPATRFGMGILSKLNPFALRAAQSKFSPVKLTKKPGEIIPGKKGFQAQDPTKFGSYKISPKPGVIPATVAGGSFVALGSAKTTEEEVLQEALDELSKTKKDEVEDKKAPDPLAGGISDEEVDAVLGADPNKISESMAEAEREAANAEAIQQSIIDFQDRYMDDKNLTRLLRNIGVDLVKSGSLTGIATGAAAAAEERAAAEALEAEREFDLAEVAAKAGGVDVSDIAKIDTIEGEYLEFYQKAASNADTAKKLQEVVRVLKTKGKNIFGVGNIVGSNFKKIMQFVAGDPTLSANKKEISQALKSEDPRTYVKTILEIIQNRNIRDLLGESGRTISNLDRQVVADLIGQLSDTKILSQSPKAIATKIELLVEDQLKKQTENEERALAKARNLAALGRDVRNLRLATRTADPARVRLKI